MFWNGLEFQFWNGLEFQIWNGLEIKNWNGLEIKNWNNKKNYNYIKQMKELSKVNLLSDGIIKLDENKKNGALRWSGLSGRRSHFR